MPASSLVDCCLTDVGSFEYWKIRQILQRIVSPEQLHQIEINSPHIKGEDAELWKAFIARDIPNWQIKNYVPKNPLKWYEVYCKYKKEQRQEIERDEETLRQSMMGLKQKRESNVSKVVDLKTLPKIPRDPRMLANNGGVPIGKGKGQGFKKEGPSALMWSAGSKTKLTDGKSVLTRARREAKEISQMSRLSRPTHQLKAKMGQVARAPPGMVNEYQKSSQPAIKILSRRQNLVGKLQHSVSEVSKPSLEEREARLRAITSGGAGPKRESSGGLKQTLVGSSDEEDEDEGEDIDDMFDEPSERPISSKHSSAALSRPTQLSPPKPFSARLPPKSSGHMSSATFKAKPQSSAPPPQISAPQRTASPVTGAPKPMMPRRKPEVDIFNRGAKKPRVR